jgi:hypothetical protein
VQFGTYEDRGWRAVGEELLRDLGAGLDDCRRSGSEHGSAANRGPLLHQHTEILLDEAFLDVDEGVNRPKTDRVERGTALRARTRIEEVA